MTTTTSRRSRRDRRDERRAIARVTYGRLTVDRKAMTAAMAALTRTVRQAADLLEHDAVGLAFEIKHGGARNWAALYEDLARNAQLAVELGRMLDAAAARLTVAAARRQEGVGVREEPRPRPLERRESDPIATQQKVYELTKIVGPVEFALNFGWRPGMAPELSATGAFITAT